MSVSEVRYRRATATDAPALADLRWKARAPEESPAVAREEFSVAYARYVTTGIRSGARAHWLGEVDGRIAACIVVQRVDLAPRPCRPDDAMGVITDLYTAPEHRCRGIGSALLSRAASWARGRDLELLAVWSSDEAWDWYGRRGFEPTGDVLQLILRPYYDPA